MEEEKQQSDAQFEESDNDKLDMEESESCDEEMNAQLMKESNIMGDH